MIVHDFLAAYVDFPKTRRKNQSPITVVIRDVREFANVYSGPIDDTRYIHPDCKDAVIKLWAYDSKARTIRIFI